MASIRLPPPSVRLVALLSVAILVSSSCSPGDEEDGSTTSAAIVASAGQEATTSEATTSEATTGPTLVSSTTATRGATTTGTARRAPEAAGCQDRVGGVEAFVSEAGGPAIEVRVFIPEGAGDRPLPVVLNWHGLGSNGRQQALLSAYEELAATEGFLAVHPTGAAAVAGGPASWELAQFDGPGRDDLAMVDEVIDRLVTDFCADGSRIYSTGLSNGGFFTALLICERADRIAAAVAVAGVSHPDGCAPSRPVPFIAFHGTADEVVVFDGGRSSLETGQSTDAGRRFFDQSMPEEFGQFADEFGCAVEPVSVPAGDGVTRHDYQGCDEDVPLSFYEITGGGHTWPGSPLGPLLAGALGPTTDEVSATTDGWAFLSRFSLPVADEASGDSAGSP